MTGGFRQLAISALSVALLPALTLVPAPARIQLQPQLASSGPWLDRLNEWRASTGVGGLVENATWSAGDYDHGLYMVKNDLVTHYETPGTPYYTTAGDTAARDSNIYVSSSTSTADTQAIDWWMGAPFHSMGLMDPRLTSTGFGSYREVKSGWQMGAAVDVLRGNPFTGGTFPVFFPGNGTTEPLTSYSGNEFPDPLQACSGYAMPVGLPVYVMVGGNVATTVTAHSLSANGVQLASCVIDSTNASFASYLTPRGAAILIPRSPLQNGTTYTASMTVNGVARTWSFTVGQFATCNVTASATPVSPAAAGAAVTVTGSATGCSNPVYEFWMLPPNSTAWRLVQGYSSNASYAWNTTGLGGGTYRFSVWAKGASSNGTFGNVLGRWDGYTALPYTLSFTACAAVTAAVTPSPAAAGTAVAVTGAASGCPSPQYEFWSLAAGSQTWQLVQSYSSLATFNWNTSGKSSGTYRFSIWARDANSPGTAGNALGTWDSYAAISEVVNTPCAAVTVTASPANTAVRGAGVSFTAVTSGCPAPLYEFWVLSPGSQTWQLAQGYSAAATFSWATSGKVPGVYHFSIWARDSSSAGLSGNVLGRWDSYTATSYTLT